MIDESDIDADVWEQKFLETHEEETENNRIEVARNLKHLQKHASVLESCIEELLSAGSNIHGHTSNYAHYEMILNKLKRECDIDESKVYKLEQTIKGTEAELKRLRSECEGIQDDILQLSEDLERLTLKEQQLLAQRKEVTNTMQSTWKAYNAAKQRYKKSLQCHIRLHDTIHSPKDKLVSEPENDRKIFTFSFMVHEKTVLAIKLSKEEEKWEMVDTEPVIPEANEAQTALHKSNDIRSFLVRLRTEALKLS